MTAARFGAIMMRRLLIVSALVALLALAPAGSALATSDDGVSSAEGETAAAAVLLGTVLLMQKDQAIVAWTDEAPRSKSMGSIMQGISDWGGGLADLGIAGGIALAGDRETGAKAANAIIAAGLATGIIKVVVGRARPWAGSASDYSGLSMDGGHHSMPSGHTATAFALAQVLGDKHPRKRALFYGAATLVGISRVYLKQHWPSDVLAGAAIGVYCGKHFTMGAPLFKVTF